MREAHILKRPKTNTFPKRIVFFDSESRVDIDISDDDIRELLEGNIVIKPHDPYLVCAKFWNSEGGKYKDQIMEHEQDYYFDNFLERFWQDVDTFTPWKMRTYLFAHNAKYDTLVMGAVPYLVKLGYTVEKFSDSNPFILKLYRSRDTGRIDKKSGKIIRERKTLYILSSTNIYQAQLKVLGKVFGLPKLDFEHGKKVDFENNEDDRNECLTYCRRDVEILAKAMLTYIDFVKREHLGTFKPTVAGQAFSAYLSRFMTHDLYIHDHIPSIASERKAYAGGRNECFRMGRIQDEKKKDIHIFGVDVNSMYPSVMIGQAYPTRKIGFQESLTCEQVGKLIDEGLLVCCECLVNVRRPLFHKKEERLIFPIGEFWTGLSTPEVKLGLERGVIKEIRNVAIYEGTDIFTNYVTYFYEKRLEAKAASDKVHDFLYKLFLNTLYGKFGQKNENWERVGKADPSIIEQDRIYSSHHDKIILLKTFGGSVFARHDEENDEESENSFPAIAAHVTANARMLLLSYIEAAEWKNCYYTDTDSLFVNEEGYNNLVAAGVIHDTRLGALALEKEGKMNLYGCKDYVFEMVERTLVKIKGVSSSSIEIEPDENGKKRFVSTVWAGYSDRLSKGDMLGYENRLQIKTLQREYTKGTVKDGYVYPFELKEA